MRTSPALPHEPDSSELERAVLRLEGEGDIQGVIRLVETWDRDGEVTLAAILAQARAFLSLKLMDRAWVRLREASQRAPDAASVLALTARVFIERGWPGRARKLVEQLAQVEPDHDDLAELQDRVVRAPQGPPADAREIERSGDPARLLALAETYLATGSFLRAKSILERVRRAEPMNRRVELLLWGLQGDFVPRGRALGQLLRDATPTAEWEGSEHTESVRRADLGQVDPPTAEVTRATLVAAGLAEPSNGDGFPSLFRQVGADTSLGGETEDEITVAAGLASPEQMRDPPAAERTDPGPVAEDDGGDTQIMQVIPGPGGGVVTDIDGPIHHPSDQPDGLKETLNLRAWQESMGMAGADLKELASDEEDFLEAEDEDLVVMTRREEAEPSRPEAAHRSGPIQVIEKHPTPLMTPSPAGPGSAPESAEADAAADEAEVVADLVEAARPERRWGRIFVVVALMAMIMAAATALVVRYLHAAASDQQLEEAQRTLAAGDYRGLLELEARLDSAVRAQAAPLEARALALAMVEAVLWGEYTGNPGHHSRAEEALAIALESGASGRSLALAEGVLALMDGNIEAAANHSAIAGTDEETGRFLAARVALASGEAEAALSLWEASDAVDAAGIRHRLLREALLRAAGRTEAADGAAARLLDAAGDNPLVAVTAASRGWLGEDLDGRLAAIADVLDQRGSELAPRQLASLHIARAQLLEDAGRAEEGLDAWRRAASVDPTHLQPLYRLGSVALSQNKLLDAERDFAGCVEANPFSADCRRGLVQTRIDLDRLDAASDAVSSWSGGASLGVPLAAWVAFERGQAEESVQGLVTAVEARESDQDGLALYLLGLALAQQDDDAARSERALSLAQQALADSGDPLDRILAARAAATRALLAPADQLDARLQEALALAPEDPVVHVTIARRYEADGRRPAARQHLDRATALAPESAVAWYARGQFYFAPATMSDAMASWQRYLALEPTGPRAERVASKVQ